MTERSAMQSMQWHRIYPQPKDGAWAFGSLLKVTREHGWGITQPELAAILTANYNIRITTAMINSYENDRVLPFPYLGMFADFFGWNLAEVLAVLGWIPWEKREGVLITKEQHELLVALTKAMTNEEKGNEQEGLHSDSERSAADGGE